MFDEKEHEFVMNSPHALPLSCACTLRRVPFRQPALVSTTALPIRKRCRALYDCKADNLDELSFYKDEVIVILNCPPNSSWWVSKQTIAIVQSQYVGELTE